MAKPMATRPPIDRFVGGIEVVSERLNTIAEVVVWVAVALTIVATFAQVVFRYGLDASLSWSEEFARYVFVWIIFIGTSVATRRGQHIMVEVIIALFPPKLRHAANVASIVVCLFFFGVLAYVGLLLVQNAWQQYSTALEIRIAWVYAAAPLGAALSILHLIAGWSRQFLAPAGQRLE
jgi:TRAP-type C4-dicarboxylate transport system permease small subunit